MKELDFKDFADKPEELIGRLVLVLSNKGEAIRKIERVTKAYFYAGGDAFRLGNGEIKGGTIWSTSWAYLITEERAKELSEKWRNDKLERELRIEVSNSVKGLSLDQLRRIKAIIDETNQPT